MCKVISVVNQKGGVGKTTTTVNVGIGLAREGKKVLLIDADPQGSLTASLGYEEPDDLRITLATIMMDVINEEEISLEDGILHHQENVDLLPANIELSALEVTMGNVMSREMIMKEYIDAIRCRYDYILIDCMPSLGMMTINALVSSDSVLIPVQAAYLPVKGLQQLIKTILTVKKRLNRKLAIEGILLTMVDFRTNYARDIASRVHTTYGSQIAILTAVFCADTYVQEITSNRSEVQRLYQIKKRIYSIIQRLMIQGTFLLLLAVLGYGLFFAFQKPITHPVTESEILQFITCFGAIVVTIFFWGILANTLSMLFRNMWMGIGSSLLIWVTTNSTGGDKLFGAWNLFSYSFRDIENTADITWLYGKGLCICIGLILLLALPKIVRKRG